MSWNLTRRDRARAVTFAWQDEEATVLLRERRNAPAFNAEGAGEGVGFGGGLKDDDGDDGVHGRLAGSGVEDMPESSAFGLEEFAADTGDRHGFVFEFDGGEEVGVCSQRVLDGD